MGTALPPNEPRYVCPLCFGTEDDIALVQPRWVWLEFFNVQPGPYWNTILGSPPVGKWLIEHAAECIYETIYEHHQIRLIWEGDTTDVRWADEHGGNLFQSPVSNGKCLLEVDSGIVYSSSAFWYGGSCKISWPTGGL